MTTDRLPITTVTWCDVSFQVLNMNCIDPLDPHRHWETVILCVLLRTVPGGQQCTC